MYHILYRGLDGQTHIAYVYACANEYEARDTFYKQYDGRIITVNKIA